ncbi:hypothetical protein BGW38_006368 [Lunasporangiospora selenospora]|uniref:Small ribosomal subunit protein uS7 domain-containing protein n=1 Tax=Lunasporangiospora selenospora TaxID=979761 RepID=A0A9P6FMN4_9FUNG|nr:hypothetical protein BGW38_006368 [Lunasporangiospora selenospora]
MLQSITRLGLRAQRHGAAAAMGSSRMSTAMFHVGTRPSAVAATSNAAATPSMPHPPVMPTLSQNAAVPPVSTSNSTTSTSAASAASESSASTSDAQESVEDVTESSSPFAEHLTISPEQARSLAENPILSQLVNTIMKDGKKAHAQGFVADALLEIRSRTHSDPYQVVLDALELASPILKLSSVKKSSKVLQVPTPMTERQRRRKAIVWILEASDKRKGEKKFKDRLASEFLAVVNGNSNALVKKSQQHKMALANRANASLKY